MINFENTTFIKSCVDKIDNYKEDLQEVLFIGRSNVGKSSLINLLTNKNRLAFVSSKPGHTRLLNYYLVDTKFFLVDAPGYGYSAIDKIFIHHFFIFKIEFFVYSTISISRCIY